MIVNYDEKNILSKVYATSLVLWDHMISAFSFESCAAIGWKASDGVI